MSFFDRFLDGYNCPKCGRLYQPTIWEAFWTFRPPCECGFPVFEYLNSAEVRQSMNTQPGIPDSMDWYITIRCACCGGTYDVHCSELFWIMNHKIESKKQSGWLFSCEVCSTEKEVVGKVVIVDLAKPIQTDGKVESWIELYLNLRDYSDHSLPELPKVLRFELARLMGYSTEEVASGNAPVLLDPALLAQHREHQEIAARFTGNPLPKTAPPFDSWK